MEIGERPLSNISRIHRKTEMYERDKRRLLAVIFDVRVKGGDRRTGRQADRRTGGQAGDRRTNTNTPETPGTSLKQYWGRLSSVLLSFPVSMLAMCCFRRETSASCSSRFVVPVHRELQGIVGYPLLSSF